MSPYHLSFICTKIDGVSGSEVYRFPVLIPLIALAQTGHEQRTKMLTLS